MDLTSYCEQGFSRSIRDTPPCHYTFKIESFSLFSNNSTIVRYESGIFEACGYKWKLALYPNGINNRNGKNHISLYLVMVDTSSLPPFWEVEVIFKFFVFDQIQDKYITIQDGEGRSRRFNGMRTKWGFDRFISHKTFKNPSSGCLVDDTCVFGVELFLCDKLNAGKHECLTMIKNVVTIKHTWEIQHFSKLENKRHHSEAFTAGNHKWQILCYPKGFMEAMGTNVSIYLSLDKSVTLAPVQKVYVNYCLRLKDQIHGKHIQMIDIHWWFDDLNASRGWPRFISLTDLNEKTKGFLVEDCCIIEAEVTVLGLVK